MRVLRAAGTDLGKNWNGYVSCDRKNEHDKAGCGAVLEVDEADLNLLYWEDAESQHYYLAVRCPECGKYNAVRGVPRSVHERILDSLNHGKSIFDGYTRGADAAGG